MYEGLYEVGNVMSAVAAVLLWGFVLDYSRLRWHVNPGGRLVMTVLVTMATVLSLVAVRNWFGDFPGHEVVRAVVYSGACAAIVAAWVMQRRISAAARRARHRD